MQRRLAALALLALFPADFVSASILTVTNASDDGTPGTLRSVLAAAAPGDTVTFALWAPTTIQLTQGALNLTSDVSVRGPGAALLTLEANDADVIDASGSVNVALSGLSLSKTGAGSGYFALFVEQGVTVSLTDATILMYAGTHGIVVDGTLTMLRTTLTTPNGSAFSGVFNANIATVMQSTISGFSCPGIEIQLDYEPHTTTTVIDSTLSGNGFGFNCGAFDFANVGDVVLVNSTLANNYRAILLPGSGSTATLRGVLMANNSAGNCFVQSPDVVNSSGHNLDSDGTCGLTDPTDISNVSAKLAGGLADNGGTTRTQAIASDSPARDAIPAGACTLQNGTTPLTLDQRGMPRPVGASCDIGAYEYAAPISASERQALLALYNATFGNEWIANGNWCAGTCPASGLLQANAPGTECGWFGVQCDAQFHVVGVSLSRNNLSGALPNLGGLSNLQTLDVSWNALTDVVPPAFGVLATAKLCPNAFSLIPSSNDFGWDAITGYSPWWATPYPNNRCDDLFTGVFE